MSSLERLPAPLPLEIMLNLCDLKSLDALRQASPLFALIFELHAVECFEYLARRSLIESVILEMRIFALATAENSVPLATQDAGAVDNWYRRAQSELPRTIPFRAISRTMRVFSYAHSTCSAVLQDKLARFHALPHEHLADQTFTYRPMVRGGVERGTPYNPSWPPAPPHWEEEQRMARGFWRGLNLRVLGYPRHFPAMAEDKAGRHPWNTDEMEVVWLGSRHLCRQQVLDSKKSRLLPRFQIVPISWVAPASCPAISAWRSLEDHDFFVVRQASLPTKAFRFFHAFRDRDFCPSKSEYWDCLRHLGLGLWSGSRMYEEFGLLNFPGPITSDEDQKRLQKDIKFSLDDLYFTWKSLYMAARATNRETLGGLRFIDGYESFNVA